MTAQITITNSIFPVAGDTLHYLIDNQPVGIVMTAPGFDQHWDFSNLQASGTRQIIYQDAQTGADYGACMVQLYTIQGQEVLRKTCIVTSGKIECTLNLTGLEKGCKYVK